MSDAEVVRDGRSVTVDPSKGPGNLTDGAGITQSDLRVVAFRELARVELGYASGPYLTLADRVTTAARGARRSDELLGLPRRRRERRSRPSLMQRNKGGRVFS